MVPFIDLLIALKHKYGCKAFLRMPPVFMYWKFSAHTESQAFQVGQLIPY